MKNIRELLIRYRRNEYDNSINEFELYKEVEDILSQRRIDRKENRVLKRLAILGKLAMINWHDWNSTMYSINNSNNIDFVKNQISLLNEKIFNLFDVDTISRNKGAEEISGEEIKRYLKNFFRHFDKLHYNIEDNFTIKCGRAELYTLLVNIINNSWYYHKGFAEIKTLGDSITISNNGDKVKSPDELFKFGFSNRPCGHGIGLAVSKELCDYWVDVKYSDESDLVNFIISPIDTSKTI